MTQFPLSHSFSFFIFEPEVAKTGLSLVSLEAEINHDGRRHGHLLRRPSLSFSPKKFLKLLLIILWPVSEASAKSYKIMLKRSVFIYKSSMPTLAIQQTV